MIAWYWLATGALALAGAISVYILVAWRHAPRASKAMKWVAVGSLVTGVLTGFLFDQVLRQMREKGVNDPFGVSGVNPCSPDGLPAADLGKAIVLTDQQHAGDPNWVSIGTMSSLCGPDWKPGDDQPCQAVFLARHALGLDLTKGDVRKCIPYEEVAELCTGGDVAKESSFCKQAFDFQRRRMSP